MENELRLSELKKMEMEPGERAVLNLIDSKAFRFFLKYILKKGTLEVTPEGVKMNGKNFSTGFVSKENRERMSKNGIKELFISDLKMSVKTAKGEGYAVILD